MSPAAARASAADSEQARFVLHEGDSEPTPVVVGLDGVVVGVNELSWPSQETLAPSVVDLHVSNRTFSSLINGSESGLSILRVAAGDRDGATVAYDTSVFQVTRPADERIVAAAFVGGANQPQVAVMSIVEGGTARLNVGDLKRSSIQWSSSELLPLDPRDRWAIEATEASSPPSFAMTVADGRGVIALGLPEWGRVGVILVWRLRPDGDPAERAVITWDGRGGFDGRRYTRLGCAVAIRASDLSTIIYSAAPEAGLEAAALAFDAESGERVDMYLPLRDRWAPGSVWSRLSPSSGTGLDATFHVQSGLESELRSHSDRDGALVRLSAGARPMLDEVE